MSDMKRCDRCGDYYEPYRKARVVQEYYPSGIGTTKNGGDVCPRCAAAFGKWWNKKRRGKEPTCDYCGAGKGERGYLFESPDGKRHVCDECVETMARTLMMARVERSKE